MTRRSSTYWATVFARAGRQPAVQHLQREYAQRIVDDVLTRSLPNIPYHVPGHGAATVEDLTGGDPYAEALVFALWTNNPRHAQEYIGDAARTARAALGSQNPAEWGTETFRGALLERCRASHFSNWRVRATLIESRAYALRTTASNALTPYERGQQVLLAAHKARLSRLLVSRHKPASVHGPSEFSGK